MPHAERRDALQSMAVTHLAALSASCAHATEPCLTVLRQLEVVASLGVPVSNSPELLALVQYQLQLLQASCTWSKGRFRRSAALLLLHGLPARTLRDRQPCRNSTAKP